MWPRLQKIYDYSRKRSGRSVIVYRHGVKIAEDYHNGSSASEVRPVRSCSKSFTAVLIAKLVAMGLLTFDTLVCTIITEWALDPLKNQITIRDLLQQRSGMQAIAFQQLTYEQVLALPATTKAWDYDNSHWIVLGEVARRIVAAEPHNKISASHALKDWVLDPAGIAVASWDQLKSAPDFSQPNMASGANITAPNMVRFCEFLRRGGDGIVPAALLAELITPQANSYCAGFWKTKDRMATIITGAADPKKALDGDDFAMLGLGFNIGYMLLGRQMTVFRAGGLQQEGEPPFIEEEFLEHVARL